MVTVTVLVMAWFLDFNLDWKASAVQGICLPLVPTCAPG